MAEMIDIHDVAGRYEELPMFLEMLARWTILLRHGEVPKCCGYSCLDWKTDERIKRSCHSGISLRVAVLVSGGVDSSVALRLLSEAGHSLPQSLVSGRLRDFRSIFPLGELSKVEDRKLQQQWVSSEIHAYIR